ncbi:MAG: NAD-dependent epimerase/dehydratase family protein [Vicinamibacterales bacterium]
MKIIVTGSAGFIGSAFVRYMADVPGTRTVGIDNLSRRGATDNLRWLQKHVANHVCERLDVTSAADMNDFMRRHRDAGAVIHLAAQTAVTASVEEPRRDFEANALGTLNLLEAVRRHAPAVPLLYASTNKVYGSLEHEPLTLRGERYGFTRAPQGINEACPLDFHSPYGCSKGAADQYVRDYARIYGMRTVVFRQSCIYGPRQYGFEEQGWVAWFAIAAATGAPITVYGDGCQVRDLLWIDDLCELYRLAIARIDRVRGGVYNIGGGPANALSVREVLHMLELLYDRPLRTGQGPWRPGDQRVFIADTAKVARDLGWKPRMTAETGMSLLAQWVLQSAREIEGVVVGAGQPV